MKFPELIPGEFIQRNNRFSADVRLEGGKLVKAYVPTTGRLTGALFQGGRVWFAAADNLQRKLPFTMILSELKNGGFCSVNASLANALFEESLRQGSLGAFPYATIEREVQYGSSRLDFRLSESGRSCWVEVKSVTYAREGVGLFPDAPTARGRKHLGELASLAAEGQRVSVVFIAQREDVLRFAPFEAVDPEFAEALREVSMQGVEVHAYRCRVNLDEIKIASEIPVDL